MNAPLVNESEDAPVGTLKRTFAVCASIAVLLAFVSGWAYLRLPETARIPIHWNARGEADGFAGRSAVFLMPAIVLGLSVLLFVLPNLEPRRGNLMRSAKAYRWVWVGLVVFLSGLHVVMLGAALGRAVRMDQYVTFGIGLLFVVIGNFLGKVRSNYLFGFRTPWTLSSDLSWNRTHRVAGWLSVIIGASLAVAAVVARKNSYLVLISGLVVLLVVPTVYSYLVWKQDPNRRSSPERPN